MNESFTQIHTNGWVITVRMLTNNLWQYIASKGLLINTGTIDASEFSDALDKAAKIVS